MRHVRIFGFRIMKDAEYQSSLVKREEYAFQKSRDESVNLIEGLQKRIEALNDIISKEKQLVDQIAEQGKKIRDQTEADLLLTSLKIIWKEVQEPRDITGLHKLAQQQSAYQNQLQAMQQASKFGLLKNPFNLLGGVLGGMAGITERG